MSGPAPLFFVWLGKPLREEEVRAFFQSRGIGNLRCELLPVADCYAAKLVSDPAQHRQLLALQGLQIGGRPAFVTPLNPLGSAREPTTIRISTPQTVEGRRPNIFKVCLTGGPCAGKTTVLSTIMSHFQAKSIRTFAVPEAATILITGGLSFANMTQAKAICFQSSLMALQLSLEQRFLEIASADEGPALIVCDRGAMDGKAYCDDVTWPAVMAKVGKDEVELRDKQYDAVYHLVTAADGAEEFYTTSNNSARLETADEARVLDKKTMQVYLGHPHLVIVNNSTDFVTKVERVLTSISELMGVSVPTHGSYHRYLVKESAPTTLPVPCVEVDIEIHILQSSDPDVEVRLLARGQDDSWSYTVQELRTINGKPVLTEKKLTSSEYLDRKLLVDLEMDVIRKASLSFTYQNQHFELGTFKSPEAFNGVSLLYTTAGDTAPVMPPFLEIDRDVTNDPKFSSSAIAQNDYGVLGTRVKDTDSSSTLSPPSSVQFENSLHHRLLSLRHVRQSSSRGGDWLSQLDADPSLSLRLPGSINGLSSFRALSISEIPWMLSARSPTSRRDLPTSVSSS
eukprot:GGOE01021632.1.p1 GENE.GGOE01021632.1~~GGOE01021632.1.p1  ORF type:complete len:579 (-),score=203.62 GGOE01021632.1:244-1947(-)